MDGQAARQSLLNRQLSLGDWGSALRHLGRLISARPAAVPSRDLAKRADNKQIANLVGGLIALRNKEIAHGAFVRDPVEAAQVVERMAFDAKGGAAALFQAFAETPWPRLEALADSGAVRLDHHARVKARSAGRRRFTHGRLGSR